MDETTNDQDPVKLFHLFLDNNDLKEARKLIRKHEEIQRLNLKELNKEYPLNGYRFTSRNGVLSIDSTKALDNKVSFEQQQMNINNDFDEFKNKQRSLNVQLLESVRELEYKNKIMSNEIQNLTRSLSQVIDVINNNISLKRLSL